MQRCATHDPRTELLFRCVSTMHASSHMLALAHEMCIRMHNKAGSGGCEQMRHTGVLACKT